MRLWLSALALSLLGCVSSPSKPDAQADARIADAGVDVTVTHEAGHLVGASNYAFPVGPAGGGLGGSYPNPTVFGVSVLQAAPDSGNYELQDDAGTLFWSPTGLLPSPGSNGQILQTIAGSSAWETCSGDITCSSSSGGNVSVVKANGASVPVSGALTTGNVLQVTGVSALGYSPVNLGGGANYVTGTLPTGNQAPQAMGGDISGTTAAAVVNQAQSGALVFGNQGQVTCASGDTTCLWTQASTSAASAADSTWTPQQSTNGTGATGGNANVNLQAPTGSSTTEDFLRVQRGGQNRVQIGTFPLATGYGAIFLGNVAPNTGIRPTLYEDSATETGLSFPIGGQLLFESSGTIYVTITPSGTQFGGLTNTFGGGSGNIIGLTSTATIPTTFPTGGLAAYSEPIGAGNTPYFGLDAQGIQFNNAVTTNSVGGVSISQDALASVAASGSPGVKMNVVSQAGQACTGATHSCGNGGVLALSSGAAGIGSGGGSSGVPGDVQFQIGGNIVANWSGAAYLNSTQAYLNFAPTLNPIIIQGGQASVGGAGAAGFPFGIAAQVGQASTGSSAGGSGGSMSVSAGAGGSSSTGTGGAGGTLSFASGAAGSGGNAAGGNIIFSTGAPSGTGASGSIQAQISGTTIQSMGGLLGTGLGLLSATQALTSGGNVTPGFAITQFPIIKLTGTLAAAGTTITMPNVNGGYWFLDITGVTLTNPLTVKSGSGTCGSAISALNTTDQMVEVATYGSNTCTLNQ